MINALNSGFGLGKVFCAHYVSLHLEMYTVTSPVSGRFDGMLRSNLAMKGKGEGTVILLVASF